jgi:hypothetical protein
VVTVVVGTVEGVVTVDVVGAVVGVVNEAVAVSEAVAVNDVAGTVGIVVGPSMIVGTVVKFPACACKERGTAADTVTSSDPDATPIRRNTRVAVII